MDHSGGFFKSKALPIAHTPDGHLWLGTDSGPRFDSMGFAFKNGSHPRANIMGWCEPAAFRKCLLDPEREQRVFRRG